MEHYVKFLSLEPLTAITIINGIALLVFLIWAMMYFKNHG